MIRANEPPLSIHKIRLYEGDLARMQNLFPETGANAAIRKLIRSFLNRVEASTAPLEIELPSNVDLKDILSDD